MYLSVTPQQGFDRVKRVLARELARVLTLVGLTEEDILSLLEKPRLEGVGHLTLPAFPLAKRFKKPPVEIARELAEHARTAEHVLNAEAAGPYVNFTLAHDLLAREALSLQPEGMLEADALRWVIEYPSPNTNKPLHLGHLRNIALGMSLTRMLQAAGQTVYQVNLNNDRGIAMSKVMVAYQHLGEGRTPRDEGLKGDAFVGKYYVLYEKHKEAHPEWEEEAYELLRKWEAGDPSVRALWRKLRDWALEGFRETYATFGLQHDKEYYESDLYERGKQIALEGLEEGIFTRDEKGNIIFEAEGQRKVILRADGTAVYITTDLALAYAKEEDYHADKYAFIVGSEQNAYFKILFQILEELRFNRVEDNIHVSYGMVLLPEGRMKSREGRVVEADDLYAEVHRMALAGVRERHPQLENSEAERRAHAIAKAAILFYLLKPNRQLDVTFHPEESVSFDGETGPYLLYTIARAKSILRKAGEVSSHLEDYPGTLHPLEEKLILTLLDTPGRVADAISQFKPSSIAQQSMRVAQAFNELYHTLPILKASEDKRHFRLILTRKTMEILSFLARLLALDVLEEM